MHQQSRRRHGDLYANIIRPFSQIFIRMIRMLIAPLLFGTLVAGIAGAGHFKDVGRMGLRAIIYFEVVTTLALFIGLAVVNILKPGVGVVLPSEAGPTGVTAAAAQGWQDILLHLVPTSIIEAMATGDILQIVVFSIVFAIGLGMVGEKAKPMIEWCESLTEAMFKVTNIVMLYAPIGVGAAIAYTIGVSGLQVLRNLAFMIASLYVALAAFYLLVLIPVMVMFRIPVIAFFKAIKQPALIASRRRRARPRCRARWSASRRSACRGGSCRSSCRSVTASTSMARRCICRWPRSSSPRPAASS